MAQRIVELLIGRLITDEQFRADFLTAPEATLRALCEQGLDLSRTEIDALIETDATLWTRAAELLDTRVQKASLRNESIAPKEKTHHV